jgi:hypothetical protein
MNITRVALLCAAMAATSFAAPITLWYGGDFDVNNQNVNALSNEQDALVDYARVYDSFTVPNGESWNISSIFSNNLMDINPGTAYWEIRSGVSSGNGGTLLYSGTDSASVTPTGRSGLGYTEYTVAVDVSGLNITLGPGTYWLAVQPIDLRTVGRAFASNTFGLNAVNDLDSGNAFFDSSYFNLSFINANILGPFDDFSMGVIGTNGAVPEPATVGLVGAALVGLAFIRRRFVA